MALIKTFASLCVRSLPRQAKKTFFSEAKHCNFASSSLCSVYALNWRFYSNVFKPANETAVTSITFIDRDDDKKTVLGKHGETLLDVAKNNDIDVEGACEGTLSCSTCHVIFDPEEYHKLGLEEPDDEELDMLDLAYGLTPTSRLCCQIEVTEKLDGVTLTVPKATRDARDL